MTEPYLANIIIIIIIITIPCENGIGPMLQPLSDRYAKFCLPYVEVVRIYYN